MFRDIPDLLSSDQVAQLRQIAAAAPFVDGRISNPQSTTKHNLQLHDPAAYQASSQIVLAALSANDAFRNFALPASIAPPLLTRYEPGMRYGAHTDAALINLPTGAIRADLSCTIFIADPGSYDGGELIIRLGDRGLAFKGNAGSCIVYPSHTLHEVAPVTRGQRLVAISFIQSRVADSLRREMISELQDIVSAEGPRMAPHNLTRLQLFQQRLLRLWAATGGG